MRVRLHRPGLPPDGQAIIERHLAVWRLLNADERQRLLDITDELLSRKRWEAARGFELDDTVRVVIAAQAALLVLALSTDHYRLVSAIVVHPSMLQTSGERPGPSLGTVTADRLTVLGLAEDGRGPIVIAWDEALAGAHGEEPGYNVVLHEFAHKLDMRDGTIDGTPMLPPDLRADWFRVCTEVYEDLVAGRPRPPMRWYGATDHGEFFAVATEVFFEQPAELLAQENELYEVLSRFYRQNPAARAAEAGGRTLMTTRTLSLAEVDLVYDIRGPLPPADGQPPLVMIGQPMDASGFTALASYFPDRTVVTYDPRGLGRSARKDGRTDNDPEVQAGDVHALIEELHAGPVELFASSGGAVTALALVTAHPGDVSTLVAHEPPLVRVLPDAAAAERALEGVRAAYQASGHGTGMAAFIAMTSWRGEFTDDYFAAPPADPAMFGMSAQDDGSRDDPLLSDSSDAVTAYSPDIAALRAARTRIVVAVGEESQGVFTGRTSAALAALLGQEATVFPSHHGGFVGGDTPYAGKPEEFAQRLREVLTPSAG